jgi:TonB-linked SusC/RagA family outer membrane protein
MAAYAQQTGEGTAGYATSKSSVTGFVFDSEGEPLPGVTVKIPKKNVATVTDINGAFSIHGNTGDIISFSYIGKKPADLKATVGSPMRVILDDDTETITEVVVTGIVNKDKNSFTGSASTFTAEELKMVGVQNPIASLAALDPAFNVLTNELAGSDPNHMPDINIRGKSSVIGTRDDAVNDPNQPLFIVDGFESSLEAVYNMDVNRIASMTILKDAASTAIYGSKAANGVVVVETVKPKIGELRFSYSGSVAMSKPDLSSYNLMNSAEKLEFERLAGRYDRTATEDIEADITKSEAYNKKLADVQRGVDTYWLSVPLRTGWNHKHNVYVDGGAGGFMFGIGLNYNGNQGVMQDSNRDSYGGNLDLIYRLDKLQFQNKFSATYTSTNDPIVSFDEYASANPYYTKYDEDGNVSRWLENNNFAKAQNPLYNASLNSRNKGSKLLLSNYFIAEYMPIDQLKVRAKFGLTHTTDDSEVFLSPSDTRFDTYDSKLKGSFTSGNEKSTRYDGALTAIYAQVIDKHRFNIAANFNVSQTKSLEQGYIARGFPEGNYTYPSFSNGYPEGGVPTYYEDTSRSADMMGTINYSYDNRYLLDANYALNGSSVFGSNKKFINTWSVGLGWNIMNEKFFRDAFPGVHMLKIRASIGNPGNQDFSSAMSLVTYRFLYNSFNYFGNSTVLDKMGNRNLSWQTTTDRNIGLDFRTDRWNFEFDYYDKNTDPLLISIAVPPSTGITTSWHTNLGIQKARGVLASATYYILRNLKDRLTWSVRGTLRHENIKLDKLSGGLDELNTIGKNTTTKRYYDGADPDAIWAVRSAGIDPANGREMFIRKDGSYTYDYNPEDEVIVGNTRSKIEGNLGTTANYKGLSVSLNFTYRLGGKAFNQALYNKVENIPGSQLIYNQDRRALTDRWQKPGDHAQFKDIANSVSTPMSSRFVQNNNSLTLQSLNITYDFYEIASKMHLEALRLSFYANDLFYLSSIKQERGTAYPFTRSYTFALSFTL